MFNILIVCLFAVHVVQAQPGSDPACNGVRAEAYSKYKKLEHGGTAFIIDAITLFESEQITFKLERDPDVYNINNFLATTAPFSDGINLPKSISNSLFHANTTGFIYTDCNHSFRLGFQLGGKWFYVPSNALILKNEKNNEGNCKTNLYALEDETVWLGRAFLNNHCLIHDQEDALGIAKRRQQTPASN